MPGSHHQDSDLTGLWYSRGIGILKKFPRWLCRKALIQRPENKAPGQPNVFLVSALASQWLLWASLVAQTVKNLPAMWETWVWSQDGRWSHSSILAWRIPWTEEPGGLQSMGSQRVGHNWVTNPFTFHLVLTSQRSLKPSILKFPQLPPWLSKCLSVFPCPPENTEASLPLARLTSQRPV